MDPPLDAPAPFSFSYRPGTVAFGDGAVADLADVLGSAGVDRGLVVTGETVGASDPVMQPVREGLGERLAGVAAVTTPEKRLATAGTIVERAREADADGFVAAGGGSSLDLAKVASVLAANEPSLHDQAATLAETGTLDVPDGDLPPVVAVPTTLAGADCSQAAGVSAGPESGLESGPESVVTGGVSDPRLFPAAVVADPSLVATTPDDVLAASAMNGFDKGIETLYAPSATPITDATASRGLQYLTGSLPRLREGADLPTYARALLGTLLVQYGVSRPDATTLSLIHAMGHGLRDVADMHQGRAHAVVAPHVLEYVFATAGGRRDVLAGALGVDPDPRTPDALADGVVEAVTAVRNALELPSSLSSASTLSRDDLQAVAEVVVADPLASNAPPGVAVTAVDVESILEAAW